MSDGYFDNPFFTREKMRCKGSGMLRLHPGFLDALVSLREQWGASRKGRVMPIRSGCRNTPHNRAVGGAPDSPHLCDLPERGCVAVDVTIANASEAWALAHMAMGRGWSVGVSTRGFLHLDARWLIGRAPVLFGY